MTNIVRVVCDTGIILQGTLHPYGPSGQVLRLLDDSKIEGFTSGRVREEYADVLRRPSVRAKNPNLTEERAQKVLGYLDSRLTLVYNPIRVIEYPRDPKDEPFINLALNIRADYLISRDNDLLTLNKSREFRLLFPFLQTVDPVTFLRAVTL